MVAIAKEYFDAHYLEEVITEHMIDEFDVKRDYLDQLVN